MAAIDYTVDTASSTSSSLCLSGPAVTFTGSFTLTFICCFWNAALDLCNAAAGKHAIFLLN